MKVLIIGGTRFVGLHLVKRLLSDGHELHLFNRGQQYNPFSDEVHSITGDRKKKGALKSCMEGENFDTAIDMIAYTAAEMKDAINALEDKIDHYLFVSTRSVYEQRLAKYPIREDDATVDDPSNVYGYNKRQAEIALQRAHEYSGFPGTILRLPAVYGPYDYQAREWYFIRRLLDGRKQMLLPDFGMSVYQREYAGNIAEQLTFLMKRTESTGKVYNSGHRHFHSFKDLINLAANIHNTKISLYGIPSNEMPWSVPLTEPKLFVSSTARLEQMGYKEPFNLEAGLKETMEYFRVNPIENWSFSERSKVNLFDYKLEDKIIADKAVELNE